MNWREQAIKNVAALGPLGLQNLERLLAACGVTHLLHLPVRQASAISWLANYEPDTVDAIIAALSKKEGGS